MFIEPNITGDKRGWIEVICGSMFSGKTEELIRRLKRAKIANLKQDLKRSSANVNEIENKPIITMLRFTILTVLYLLIHKKFRFL